MRALPHKVSSLCSQAGMSCSSPPSPTARFLSRMASCWPQASTSTGAVLTVPVSAPSLTGCDSRLLPGFIPSVHMHTCAYTHFPLFFFFLLSLRVILTSSRQPKQVHVTISKSLAFVYLFYCSARFKLVIILLLQPPKCSISRDN